MHAAARWREPAGERLRTAVPLGGRRHQDGQAGAAPCEHSREPHRDR